MKYFKIFFFTCLLSLAFVACTNDNDITEPHNVQESEAVQNAISQLQTHFDDNGVLTDEANPTGNLIIDFCFEFVYPITLIYNNGATVTVENLGELITVIINSTPELYIVGIEFPFDVIWYNPATNETEIVTITSEQEFIALLESCDFDPCICPDVVDPVCVEIQTPNGGEIITFPNACFAECEGFTEEDFVDCPNDCDCTDEFDPVCVESQGGIIQFDNECLALCEGYTPNDFVDCPSDGCEIMNVAVEVGQCDPAGNVYEVTINFEVNNPPSDTFEVLSLNGELIGNFPYSSLPLTLEFELNGADTGGVVICVNDIPECCSEIIWDLPVCDGDECSITNLSVDVGECNDPASGTYNVTIDFQANNPGNDHFDLYSLNGEFLGFYPLSSLPLTLEFQTNGGGNVDGVIVCINDNPDCCADITWEPPTCNTGECSITNLAVDVGDCNPAGGYTLTIDFDHENAGNEFFDLYIRNDELIGFFELADLPLTIDFEPSGNDYDYIRVCINDNPDCCAELEFMPPVCQDACECNDLFNPVCVEVAGTVITYYNACYAECDGFTEADFVDCQDECADCGSQPYEPICVEFAGGVLTMYNECFLFCNGFTPNDIVDCN